MRPRRGRDASSALAPAAHTLLCGGPLICTADPSRPAEDWWLVERLRGPEGETVRVRDGAPSGRTSSLAIREGALGYRTPQPLPLPSAQWPPWRLPEHVGRAELPPSVVGVGSRVRRPRGGAACRSLPSRGPRLPPPSRGRVPLGPAGRPAGGGPCARARPPPWREPWGKRGAVLGRDAGSASASPAPQLVARGRPSRPPSPPEPQLVAACGHGLGRLARERCPQGVGPRGQTRMEDGSVADGRRETGGPARRPWRRGRVAGHAPGMAGTGRRPGRRGTALACGWRWDPALVFLGARPRARSFSSGPRTWPAALSRGPRRACLPAPPRRCRPRLSRSRACDRPRPRPLSGPEPASPHVGGVPRPLPAGGVPGRSSALGALSEGAGRGAPRA